MIDIWITEYQAGASVEQIAKKHGVNKHRVYYQLRKANVIRRRVGAYYVSTWTKKFKDRFISDWHKHWFFVCKRRAKQKGLEWNLEPEDFVVPSHCPLLGIPLYPKEGLPGPNSPSMDRIDSTRGYTRDNVWIISHRANSIKRDATLAELKLIADGLAHKIG